MCYWGQVLWCCLCQPASIGVVAPPTEVRLTAGSGRLWLGLHSVPVHCSIACLKPVDLTPGSLHQPDPFPLKGFPKSFVASHNPQPLNFFVFYPSHLPPACSLPVRSTFAPNIWLLRAKLVAVSLTVLQAITCGAVEGSEFLGAEGYTSGIYASG